jgi:hypothetical protein
MFSNDFGIILATGIGLLFDICCAFVLVNEDAKITEQF